MTRLKVYIPPLLDSLNITRSFLFCFIVTEDQNDSRSQELRLDGFIPVVMSGTSVLVPLRIWLLPSFPDTPPLVYVVPRDNIKIKLGRNVYTSGKVRHRDIQRWRHVSHETPLFSKMATCHMIPLSIVISNYVDM